MANEACQFSLDGLPMDELEPAWRECIFNALTDLELYTNRGSAIDAYLL